MVRRKILAGMEETRLLRDFNRFGLDPKLYEDNYYWDAENDDHQHHGWVMFSPQDVNEILDMLGRYK